MWSIVAAFPPSLVPRKTLSSTPRRLATSTRCCQPSTPVPVLKKKRKRYRLPRPGEDKGITEEMRFVALRLHKTTNEERGKEEDQEGSDNEKMAEATWEPTMKGLMRYLVDSRLVFETIETIVDHSENVTYAHFRNTGLERAESLSKDIEYFSKFGFDIPGPSLRGTNYANYLKDIAASSTPSFLAHLYNIYFAHIYGGQVICEQVSKKLFSGRLLEFQKWEGNEKEMLKDVRDKLNIVGEHWPRKEKNQCLKETAKCFRFAGQIIRLITS